MGNTVLGGGSPLNKFKEIQKHLSRNKRTVYVGVNGDDVLGDGSIESPYSTFDRAMADAVGTTLMLTISLGDGEHSTGESRLRIDGVVVGVIGSGSLRLVGNAYGHHAFIENAYLYLNCQSVVTDAHVDEIFAMTLNSAVFLDTKISCSNAGAICNTLFGSPEIVARGEFHNSSNAPIPLVKNSNGAAPTVQYQSLSLINVTE